MKTYDDIITLLEQIGFKKYPKITDTEYYEYDNYKCKIIFDNKYFDFFFDVYKLNKKSNIQDVVYSNEYNEVYKVLSEEFKSVLRKLKINKLLSDK